MTYVPVLLSLFAIDLLAAMSPGPNFVLVTQSAIHRTSRHAIAVVVGFALINLAWCLGVAFGLSALFLIAPQLYRAMKLAGGAYLVYLGVTLWRSKETATTIEPSFQTSVTASFIRGMLTNLSNPKSVVYFGSIFTLFMRPGTPAWVQAIAVTIVIFDTFLWYGSLALFFSRAVVQRRYLAIERPINRIAGAVMIGFGARLMLARD
jgi:threonine efflux protein